MRAPSAKTGGHEWFWRILVVLLACALAWMGWVAVHSRVPHERYGEALERKRNRAVRVELEVRTIDVAAERAVLVLPQLTGHRVDGETE